MNTIRLQCIYRMAGRTRKPSYTVHVNCPCKVDKSLAGTFDTVEAAYAAARFDKDRFGSVEKCAKSQPLIEEPKARKPRGKARKTRFVEETLHLAEAAIPGYVYPHHTSTGHAVSFGYDGQKYTFLTVQDEKGNSFEIRHPFTKKNAKEVVIALWDLMKTLEK